MSLTAALLLATAFTVLAVVLIIAIAIAVRILTS